MKKLTSLLLALIMLTGMVPVTAMPAAAVESTPILGYYYGQEILVDGKLDEAPWIMRDRVGGTAVTLLCGDSDLYMGLYTKQSAAVLTINGVEAKVDFDLGSVMVNGEKMGEASSDADRGTAELRVSMAAFGLEYLRSQTVSLAMTIGSDRYTGTALLADTAIAFAENFDDIANRSYAKSMGGDTAEVYSRQDDQGLGALHMKTGDLTANGSAMILPNFKMGSNFDPSRGYTVTFTADFNDLVVAGQPAYLALSAFCVDVRADVYNRHGFYADEAGNIFVTLYDTTTTNTKFDTGFDLPAKNVNVRIEVDDDFASEVFMNGKSVGVFPISARRDDKNKTMGIGASTVRRGSDARKNDVMVYDLLFEQEAPAIKLQAGQLAGAKDLTMDGALDEMFWTMRTVAGDTKIGALCDGTYLYLGVDSQESTLNFNVNGTNAKATLSKNPKFELGFTMGSTIKGNGKGQYEISIPLSLMQMENPVGKTIDFVVTAAGVTKEYALTLGGGTVLQLVTKAPASGDGRNDTVAYLDTAGLSFDGQIKENQWYNPYNAAGTGSSPAANVGFLWNSKAMFVGGQVFDTARAKSVVLTLGGKTLTADLTVGTADVGEVKTSGQTFEWRIPFANLGIGSALNVEKDYKLEISNAGGTSTLYGKLKFTGQVMVWGDSCQDFNAKNYVVTTTGKYTKWNSGANGYELVTEPGLPADRNEYFGFYSLLDFDGHAYELNFDMNIKDIPRHSGGTIVGWRGLCFEIRQANLQTRFCFTNDGNDELLVETPYYMFNESKPTGIKLGERVKITIKVDEERNPTLYVNDKFVLALPRLDREQFTITDSIPMPRLIINAMNYSRVPNADGELGELDAEIYSMTMTQTPYADDQSVVEAAADTITEKMLLGSGDPQDVTQLNLPATVTAGDMGVTCDVKWTIVDAATGMKATNVNLTTGKVTRAVDPMLLNLTAEVSYNGVGATRTFQFQTEGKPGAGKVAMIYNDMAPTTGTVTDWSDNSYQYFDTEQNSIVIDQGSSKKFTTIKLYDSDEVSRVAKQHLGVFISDDGKNFTKVLGWHLHQDGKEYTIYNLNETARYVKVHTYHDNWAMSDYEPSFYNAIPKMIAVGSEALPGVTGGFAHSADYVVKNTTGKEQHDYAVLVTISDLGAKAGQYKADASDFRFTMGDEILPYWYNGQGAFYVQVPRMAADGSATVKAHWGNSSAKNFSDATAVFEVSYGNVAVLPMTVLTEMGTHGRPWMFPNGDFIVVGRQGGTKADVAIYRSTDGGQTFAQKAELAYNDAAYVGYGSGFGGFMYNEHTGRLYLLAYRGSTKDKNDYRIMLLYTDDNGETWSEPLSLDPPNKEPWGDNSTVIQNYPEQVTRHFLYGDGVTLSGYDGDGPNVDYVFSCTADDYSTDPFTYAPLVLYSKDDGKTWTCSKDQIRINVDRTRTHGTEDGVSETSVVELSNGDLYLVVRTQQEGNYYLWQAVSKDQGVTWEQSYSNIISVNSSPCLRQYGDNRILLWTGMNGLGATSYHRMPAHAAITTDDYKSFDKIVDLTFGTSLNTVRIEESRMTQPGIAVSEDGNTAVVAYYDNYWLPHGVSFAPGVNPHQSGVVGTMAFRVDQFDDVIRYNKGGYDDFEVDKLKYQGWLCDSGHSIVLSSRQSVSGIYSMKVEDVSAGAPAHALRQVPSMKYGTVGAKVMVPVGNKDDFALELKAAYNYDHMKLTLAAVAISPDGTVSICSDNGKTAVTKVAPGTWNDFAISFDIAADMGKLYVNGKAVGDIALKTTQIMTPYEKGGPVEYKMENGIQEVTCVQFNQLKATDSMGDCLYVDDFYATDLTTPIQRSTYEIAFNDVKQGDWYYDAVNFAVDNSIMSGYSADKFGPNDTLTRAMVVQVLYNKEGQPALNGLKHSFSDVPASQWYNNAVTWGSNRGVVSGYGGGVFKPEDAVTIEQVAVILWNYSNTPAGYGNLSGVGSYSDWAANALRWAVDKGVLDNVPFKNVTEQATRAQTAQMLTNYLRSL